MGSLDLPGAPWASFPPWAFLAPQAFLASWAPLGPEKFREAPVITSLGTLPGAFQKVLGPPEWGCKGASINGASTRGFYKGLFSGTSIRGLFKGFYKELREEA